MQLTSALKDAVTSPHPGFEHYPSRKWMGQIPRELLAAIYTVRLGLLHNPLGPEVGCNHSEGRDPQALSLFGPQVIQYRNKCRGWNRLPSSRWIVDTVHLERCPRPQRNCFINPALVDRGVVAGVAGLAGQAVPVRLSIRPDVQQISSAAPPTRGKVVTLDPERKTWGTLLVGIGEDEDIRLEVAVQESLRIFYLNLFVHLGKRCGVLMADGVIANFMSLSLCLPPIV